MANGDVFFWLIPRLLCDYKRQKVFYLIKYYQTREIVEA